MDATAGGFVPGTVGAAVESAGTAMGSRPVLEIGDQVLGAAELAAAVVTGATAVARITAPGDRVAFRADADAASLILLLAIAAAGRVAVPVDPREPPERVEEILRSAEPSLRLCTEGDGDGIWSPWVAPTVALASPPPADPPASPDDLALLLFTSGTTGRPKGIVRTHRMLVDQAVAQAARWPRIADPRLGNVYPLAFLGGILTFLACVEVRGTCCALDAGSVGPAGLAAALRDRRITLFLAVPSLLRAVCEHARRQSVDLSRMRFVAFGGEPITTADLRLMRAVMPHAELLNCYGTQEAGTVAWHTVEAGREDAVVPAGSPSPDSIVLVVDGTTVCPPGTVGEIVLAGPNVCVEYWRDPAATAAARVEIDGTPAMRTGDLGRWNDGILEVLGRTDHRVKVRGQGVDLSAVEAALLAEPTIAAAAVTSLPDPRSGNRLIAHLTPRPGAVVVPVDVRRTLHDRLPGYMVPGTVLVVDAMPLTPRGKVDRAALHAAALDAPPPPRGRDPHGPVEARIRELMAEVLAIEPDDLGCDDDFAAHGGDSLRALELLEAIEDECSPGAEARAGLEAALAGSATVAALAAVLDGQSGDDPDDPPPRRRGGSALVAIATPPGPTRSPCYLVLGAAHHPFSARALAAHLPGVALGAIFARGVTERAWPDRSIAAMARHSARLVEADHPGGPIVLVGYSIGALVAMETARALRARGATVPVLVLVDMPARRRPTPAATGRPRIVPIAASCAAAWTAPFVVASRRAMERRRRALLDLCGPPARRYRPEPYPGDVVVVRTSANDDARPALGWDGTVTGTLRVVELPGTHASILREPEVAALGALLLDVVTAAGERD